jgi:WXG100 family type VII secretion target
MTFDGLWVDHGGLEATADDLMHGVDRIDERLQTLARDLAPLRSHWVGAAHEAYLAAQARWDTAVEEMRDLLSSTAAQVRRSNAAYAAADARAARAFDM